MENTQKPEDTKEKPSKIDYSEQLYNSMGTKKDTEKLINDLLKEIQITNEKGRQKAMERLYNQELKVRKSNELEQNIGGGDIPIDGDIINGTRVFMRNCQSCHSLEVNNSGVKTTGPALGMIYGRKAGIDPHYEYSESLLRANFVWNEKRLFGFMKNPKEMVKGVKCEIPDGGIENVEDRADLTRFLKKFTKELHKNLRVKANSIYGKEYVDNMLITKKGIRDLEIKRNEDKNRREGR